MRYKTHIVTSLTAGFALMEVTPLPLSVMLGVGILIGSTLPDIDEPESYIGRRTLGVSNVIKAMFGHRGFTHSLLATLLVAIPYFIFHHLFFLGIALGYLFHIVGDMLSVTGVPLFHPFSKKKVAIPLYKTGGIREHILLGLSVIAFIYLLIY